MTRTGRQRFSGRTAEKATFMPADLTMYIFLGRRGALSQWALDIAKVAEDRAILVISRQNEIFDQIQKTGAKVIGIDTFDHGLGALMFLPRIFSIRRELRRAVISHGVKRVVILMSHVWTPLIGGALKRCGARYAVIVHDAEPHPGDHTGWALRWLIRDALMADEVVTLSTHVARMLVERYPQLKPRVKVLFHPLLGIASTPTTTSKPPRLRFLFFGRIMPYKGLSLFVSACELLSRTNVPFDVGIVGQGPLGPLQKRLEALGAEIVNRWIQPHEVSAIMSEYDVVVVPNTEASQSGVIPAALASGLPVIATPVGGLPEQIENGRTGIITDSATTEGLARAMTRFVTEPDLQITLARGVCELREQLSMSRFLDCLAS
jgi:glycosyltransferase involved in cell wall biosynthesis